MTGYGSAVFDVAGQAYTLELRSLNSRHVDVRVRLPWQDSRLESMLSAAAKSSVARGRLEVVVRAGGGGEDQVGDTLVSSPGPGEGPGAGGDGAVEAESAGAERGQDGAEPLVGVTADRFRRAHADLVRLCAELGMDARLTPKDVVSYATAMERDLATSGAAPPGFDVAAVAALREAHRGLLAMRRREGKLMAMAIGEQMAEAASMVTELERVAAQQPLALGEKLRERMDRLLEGLGGAPGGLDQARLTAEIALLVDRADVTEELVRLRAHFAHFAEIMAGHPPHGRKLDFLLQEMFREVNTTGAKSHDSRSGKLVVDLKSVFEKLREVVQNVE